MASNLDRTQEPINKTPGRSVAGASGRYLQPSEACRHRCRAGRPRRVLLAAGFWVGRLGLRPIAEVTDVADAIAAGNRSRRVVATAARPRLRTLPGQSTSCSMSSSRPSRDFGSSLPTRLMNFVRRSRSSWVCPNSGVREPSTGEDVSDDAMRRVGQSGRRMGSLVEDLLLLAHLDDGRPLELKPVDLEPLLHDAIHDAAATDPLRSITWRYTGGVVAMGDEMDFARSSPTWSTNSSAPHSAAGSDHYPGLLPGARVTLDVVDSGPGMTANETSKAFDRFWRADVSRTRSGTGLVWRSWPELWLRTMETSPWTPVVIVGPRSPSDFLRPKGTALDRQGSDCCWWIHSAASQRTFRNSQNTSP